MWIAHGVKTAAKLCAEGVAVVPAQVHAYIHARKIRGQRRDPDAGSPVRRIDVKKGFEQARMLVESARH